MCLFRFSGCFTSPEKAGISPFSVPLPPLFPDRCPLRSYSAMSFFYAIRNLCPVFYSRPLSGLPAPHSAPVSFPFRRRHAAVPCFYGKEKKRLYTLLYRGIRRLSQRPAHLNFFYHLGANYKHSSILSNENGRLSLCKFKRPPDGPGSRNRRSFV